MSDEYILNFHPDFFKDFKKLNKTEKEWLVKIYKRIKENPTQFKHLSGKGNCYSVRLGSLITVYYLESKIVWFLVVERRKIVYEIYLKRLYNLKEKV